MPILKAGGKLILFVHIPKTGGSSIEAYMRSKGTVSLCYPKRLEGITPTPQHFHRARIDALFAKGFFDAEFAVVRDPLDRLVSEFRFRARAPRPKDVVLRRHKTDLALIRFQGRKRVFNFDSWVSAVFDRYVSEPGIYDNHIRPQADFIAGHEQIFLFEDGLQHAFNHLDQLTNTPPSTIHPHEKAGRFPRPGVSAETADRVRDFYAKDYALFAQLKARQ